MKTNKIHIELIKPSILLWLFLVSMVVTMQAQEINNNGIDDDGDCNVDCDDLDFGLRTVQYTNGMNASFVVGQTDFVTSTAGIGPRSFNRPYDVAVDPTTGKVFVSDLNNHRVLRYATYDDFIQNNDAEAVVGQSNLNGSTSGASSKKLYQPTGIFVDDNGTLWVTDWGNNRVLKFDNASILGNLPSANVVLGQSNFNNFNSDITPSRMSIPVDLIVDDSGTLWVADQGNGRVLRFDNASSKTNGASADGVLGAPDMWTPTGIASRSDINSANGVAMICNSLYVSDGPNNRVLRWDNPSSLSDGANASVVLGQSNFTNDWSSTSSTSMDFPRLLSSDSKNNLFVNDASNNRILVFYEAGENGNGAAADVVLGQNNFTTSGASTTQNTLNSPRGVAVIENGLRSYVAVAEALGHRITIFGHGDLSTNELTAISDVLPGYDSSGSGGINFSIVSQPGSGSVTINNSSTGAFTFTPGGSCPYDVDHVESFTYQVTNNNGCSVTGEVAVSVEDVVACTEIAGNGIDDDGDCNTDCEDMSFGLRVEEYTNGMVASHVMGQGGVFGTVSGLSDHNYNQPYDVAMDPTTKKVFVSDSHNHRVLRYASMNSFIYDSPAEAVFGQPDFNSKNSAVDASSFSYPAGIFIDDNGSLWVADWGHRRVLRFDNASQSGNGVAADGVLGQNVFTTQFARLTVDGFGAVTDVVVDENGTLYVAEESNGRVTRFDNAASKPNGAPADGVLGSPDFTSNPASVDDRNMQKALGLAIVCDRLYVSDGDHHRILWWNSPATQPNGASANGVLGQADFTNGTFATSQNRLDTPRLLNSDKFNNLVVADEGNDRVLIFYEVGAKSNGDDADVVIGQNNFNASFSGTGNAKLDNPYSATFLQDGLKSYLVICDETNNRIMGFGGGFMNTTEILNLNSSLPGYDPSGSGGLTFTILTQPSFGTISIVNSSTGQFLYTPGDRCIHDDDFEDRFVYQVSNANGCTQIGEMTIHISDTGACIENCTNGIDDDSNGLVDAEDPECDRDGDGVINGEDIDLDNDGLINLSEESVYGGLGFCTNVIIKEFVNEDFGVGLRGESEYIPTCFEPGSGAECSSHYDENTYSSSLDWGEYCLVLNTDLANQGMYNWVSQGDIITGANNRIAVFNGGNESQIIYERIVEGLVIGSKLHMDLKFLNLATVGANVTSPKVHFEIWSLSDVLLFTSSALSPPEDGNWHGAGSSIYSALDSKVVVKLVLEAAALPGNDIAIDKIVISQEYRDCDNDGIPNIYDLDNDNDGITNLVEQGHVDVDGNGLTDNINGDGSLSIDNNNNGADDTYEGEFVLDTDGDHLRDVFDLDTDNDGIYDVLEAGGVDPNLDGLIGSGAFVDGNGNGLSDIVDPTSSGTPLINKDSDNDGNDDAKELDSDNDGCFDVSEAGFPDGDTNGLLGTGVTGSGLNVNGVGLVTP